MTRLLMGVFLLLSILWLYNTNDPHQMLLATCSIVMELVLGAGFEIEQSIGERIDEVNNRIDSAIRESTRSTLIEEFRGSGFQSQFEVALSGIGARLDDINYNLKLVSERVRTIG